MMLPPSFFVLFNLFLCVLATVPATVYRGDSRSPAQLKKVNGFQTYAATNNKDPNDDLIVHCMGGHDDNDGYVSTTLDYKVATSFGRKKDGWVYYIDTSKNPSQYVDVAAWCKANNEKNPIPKEKEFASKGSIPWSNIVKWDKIVKNKVASTETRIAFDAADGKTSRPSSPTKGSAKRSTSLDRSNVFQIRGATREEITDQGEEVTDQGEEGEEVTDLGEEGEEVTDEGEEVTDEGEEVTDEGEEVTDQGEEGEEVTDEGEEVTDEGEEVTDQGEEGEEVTDEGEEVTDDGEEVTDLDN
jgi:hypothetical protein